MEIFQIYAQIIQGTGPKPEILHDAMQKHIVMFKFTCRKAAQVQNHATNR